MQRRSPAADRRPLRLAARALALGCLVIAATAPLRPQLPDPSSTDLAALVGSLDESLDAAEVHHYHVLVPTGQTVQVVVEQNGAADVELVLDEASGELVMDHLTGPLGDERLTLYADGADRLHLLQVRNAGGPDPDLYSIRLIGPAPITQVDLSRAAAERSLVAGQTTTDRTQARAHLADAASHFSDAGEPLEQVYALDLEGRRADDDDDYDRIEQIYQQAMTLLAGLPTPHLDHEARILVLGGLARRERGQAQEAKALFELAVTKAQTVGLRQLEISCKEGLGDAHAKLWEVDEARALYEEALHHHQFEDPSPKDQAMIHNKLGALHMEAGELVLADLEFTQAKNLAIAGNEPRIHAEALTYLARVRRRQDPSTPGQLAAETLLEDSLPLRDQAGDKKGRLITLGELGKVYRNLGQIELARDAYDEALLIAREIDNQIEEAVVLANLAYLENTVGQQAKAETLLERSIELLEGAEHPSAHAESLYRQAAIALHKDEPGKAWSLLETALALVEQIRLRSANMGQREQLLASKRQYYDLAVEALVRLDEDEPGEGYSRLALTVSDRSRARVLRELLALAEIDPLADAPSGLLAERAAAIEGLRKTQATLLKLTEASGEGPSGVRNLDALVTQLERKKRARLSELEHLEARLRRTSPRYAAAGTSPEVTAGDLATLQRNLSEGSQILTYFLGEQRSFGWLIDRHGIIQKDLPGRAWLAAEAENAHEYLSQSRLGSYRRRASQQALRLAHALLGPFAEHLDGERLIVLPDGPLYLVPFAALPDPAPPAGGERYRQPLVAEREIHVLQSLALFDHHPVEPATLDRSSHLLAVIADPVFDPSDRRDGRAPAFRPAGAQPAAAGPAIRGLRSRPYRRLANSGAEARAISQLVPEPARYLAEGLDANLDLVRSGRLARFQILHFATHGRIDRQNPELSGIVLSLVDEQYRPRDGYLYTHEIFDLDLSARLVVLSACDTARGQQVRGEGVVGLSRAFMAAGAPRLVASLWAVDDEITGELMTIFYQGLLGEGLTPAAALRRAQREIAARPGSTYQDWAAWVLLGDPSW